MVKGEDKLKVSAKANFDRNRQRFERKKNGDLVASTRELAVSTRPQEFILPKMALLSVP